MDRLSSDLASLKIDRSQWQEGGITSHWWRWVLGLIVLVATSSFVLPGLEAELFQAETAVIVDLSPSLSITSLTATGYVVVERRAKVGASISGRIAKLHVREGSSVNEGDVLVELDCADHKSSVAAADAQVLAAQARVASAEAALAEVRLQVRRQTVLAEQGAATRSVVEDLTARAGTLSAEVGSVEAQLRAVRAQAELARVNLGRMTIRAPLSGTVLDKPLAAGEMVGPQPPILELADMTSLIVEVDVPEARLSLVKVGGPVEITLDAFPGQRRAGRVHEVGKRVNRAKATVPVKVAFAERWAAALPDMSAHVSFLTEALDASPRAAGSKRVVPSAAVTERQGAKVVFVFNEGRVSPAPVRLGQEGPEGVELLEGPKTGVRVVLNPPATLAAGQKIKSR